MKNKEFEKEINYIKDIRIKESLKIILDMLPDYFYEVEASSTGKYHPEFSTGNKGLVRHTKSAVRIAIELFNDSSLTNFTNHEQDMIIFAITIHDGLKHGLIEEKYTRFDHPLLISQFLENNKDKMKLTDDELHTIRNCVETHMGPWTKDYFGNEVLEKPTTEIQKFVHLCDYLSSRRFLNIKFTNNIIED